MTLRYVFWLAALAFAAPSYADLMVQQHGTLNIVENDAYLVLSLPASAFEGIDDDGNGSVSMTEFDRHRADIVETVKTGVTLNDLSGSVRLEGLKLMPEVLDHPVLDIPDSVVSQIVVLGRYDLGNARSELHLAVELYGRHPEEQSVTINAMRRFDHAQQVLNLSPENSAGVLFAEREALMADSLE